MPYYNYPYAYGNTSPYGIYQQQQPMSMGPNINDYMKTVDGEMAARAWQPPVPMPPNTVIPLWDLDGKHVYFKSTDAYGRMNPIRKGRVVFEDEEMEKLPAESKTEARENSSQEYSGEESTTQYATKEDFDALRKEIRNMFHQNGRRPLQNESRATERGDR